jgi:glycosyltransferase involved in cell wall biosynthesis
MPDRAATAPTDGRAVPPFDARTFAPRAAPCCVCVFVLNEGERIRRQLARMAAVRHAADIVVVDGGSTDGSLDDATLGGAGVRALLVNRGPRGLSAQMRVGLAWALDQGYEGVILIDGNDKDDPAAIPQFAAALARGVDHVQGSRYVPGGVAVNTPWRRSIGVRFLHAPLISLAAGRRYTDTTNGFRAYSRRLLEDPRVAPFREVFVAYELHYYLAIRAARLGFRVEELPVTRVYPRGKVPTKITPFKGELKVLRTLFGAVAGAFDPPHDPGSV